MELPALEDPWHEAEPTEIYERMRHLEMLCCKMRNHFALLRPTHVYAFRVHSGELMHPKHLCLKSKGSVTLPVHKPRSRAEEAERAFELSHGSKPFITRSQPFLQIWWCGNAKSCTFDWDLKSLKGAWQQNQHFFA